jgi:hypothetical protein
MPYPRRMTGCKDRRRHCGHGAVVRRTIVAYQVSRSGGGRRAGGNTEAGACRSHGLASSIGALKHLPRRQAFAARTVAD